MKRIEIIDFLKGFSIFTIVIFHYFQKVHLPNPFDKLISFGGTGVHLFVLLSGIGLYLSYLNRPEKYPFFLKKRFSKVYIPYIVVVFISVVIGLIIPMDGFNFSWYALGGHVFLYKMFDETIIGSYGAPLWFISMIFQFYFMFFVIIFFKKHTNNTMFFIISLVISLSWAFVVASLGHGSMRIWNSFFLQYLWEFALGMIIAEMLINKKTSVFNIRPIYILIVGLVCSVIYAVMAFIPGGIGKLFNDIPALLGYSSIGVWIYLIKSKVINKFFLFTGKISYSFYLLHILILKLFLQFSVSLPLAVTLIIALPFTYLVAYYYQIVIGHIYKLLKI